MSNETVSARRWGSAMTDESLAACRSDVESGGRAQLAQDVLDLLAEVKQLRFNIRCLTDPWPRGAGSPSSSDTRVEFCVCGQNPCECDEATS